MLGCGTGVERANQQAGVCLLKANAGQEVTLYSANPCLLGPGSLQFHQLLMYLKEEKEHMRTRAVSLEYVDCRVRSALTLFYWEAACSYLPALVLTWFSPGTLLWEDLLLQKSLLHPCKGKCCAWMSSLSACQVLARHLPHWALSGWLWNWVFIFH